MRARRVVAVMAALALASCVFATDFGQFTSGDADASQPIDAGDASIDGADAAIASDAGDASLGPMAWRAVASSGPSPRHSMRLAFDDARGVTWMFGGWQSDPNGVTTEMWSWDGKSWSGPTKPPGPPDRHGGVLAYDSGRKVAVLFGGLGAAEPGDVWEWNGMSWSSPAGSTGPSVIQTTGVYDADRGVVVIFGGHIGNPGESAETWGWNGKAWAKQPSPTSPAARTGHAMAYDADRKKIVLTGGHDSSNHDYDDTWEWNGTWTRAMPATPIGTHSGACAAYHAARRVVVLFGGRDANFVGGGDTWLYDGIDWKRGPSGPPARFACSMAYDAARRAIVLFGGSTKYVDTKTRELVGDTWVLE